jgi:hypothetical protein
MKNQHENELKGVLSEDCEEEFVNAVRRSISYRCIMKRAPEIQQTEITLRFKADEIQELPMRMLDSMCTEFDDVDIEYEIELFDVKMTWIQEKKVYVVKYSVDQL